MRLPAVHNLLCAHTIVAAVLLSASSTTARAQVLYVDDSATGADDGSSWCDAYRNLQDALHNASTSPVHFIRVAGGTHHPDRGVQQQALDRAASFTLVPGTMIMGGYAGCGAPDPDFRDPSTYITILSGDLLGNDDDVSEAPDCPCLSPGDEGQCTDMACRDRVLDETACDEGWTWQDGGFPGCALRAAELCCDTCPATATRCDNSWHVVRASGIPLASSEVTGLDGCTITGGYANGPGEYAGGGLLCLQASPTFGDCRFVDNRAADDGGAALITAHSHPWFESCTFENNLAGDDGGAIKNINSAPRFTACTFLANASGFYNPAGDGGAVLNSGESTAEFHECQFMANHSPDSGGAVYNEGSIEPDQLTKMTLRNTSFQNNEAGERGGAVHSTGNAESTLQGNLLFAGNTAPAGGSDWALRSGSTSIDQARSGAGSAPIQSTTVTADVFEVSLDSEASNPLSGQLELTAGTTTLVDALVIREDALNEFAKPMVAVDGILTVKGTLSTGGDPGDCTPPEFCTRALGQVTVLGDFKFSGNARIDVDAVEPLTLHGHFINTTSGTLAPQFFRWNSPLVMAGDEPQQLDVAGADLGPLPYGSVSDNFGIRRFEVTANSDVRLVPAAWPSAGTGCPALYVETLIIEKGATLSLDDVIVYADSVVDLGGSTCFSGPCAELSAPDVNTCQLYDINQDCQILLSDDLPDIIDCMFRDDCACVDGNCVCAIDCNCDGALTVVGDGRCLVDCFQNGDCPICDDRDPAGTRSLAIGGIVADSAENPLLNGISARVEVQQVLRNRSNGSGQRWSTTTDDIGIWSVPKLTPGPYNILIRAGQRTERMSIDLTEDNQRRLQNILTVFPKVRMRSE